MTIESTVARRTSHLFQPKRCANAAADAAEHPAAPRPYEAVPPTHRWGYTRLARMEAEGEAR